MIKDPFIKKIDRGEGKELILFSKNDLNYKFFKGLPPILDNQTHLRFHPTRSEWVGYSSTRQNRTFLPNSLDCPLCPMTNNKIPQIFQLINMKLLFLQIVLANSN